MQASHFNSIPFQTLDYISSVLAINDWGSQVPSLADAFPGISIGGWELGKHFLRIDGTTSASDRGNRINRFEEDSIRLFLISSRAGGIGINLCSANRVSNDAVVSVYIRCIDLRSSIAAGCHIRQSL